MSLYQSIFPKRTAPVIPADFDGVPLKLGYERPEFRTEYLAYQPDIDAAMAIALWNKFIPYMPSEFYKIISYALPDMPQFEIKLADNGVCLIEKPKAHSSWEAKFKIDLVQHHLGENNSSIKLDENIQGQGIGTRWFVNFIELQAALGFQKVLFGAGLTNGAFTWASFGARVHNNGIFYYERQKPLTRDLLARVAAVSDQLNDEILRRAMALCQIKQKDDLVNLVRLPDALVEMPDRTSMSRTLAEFFQDCHLNVRRMQQEVEHTIDDVGSVFKVAADRGRQKVHIGRLALVGQNYPGEIDLKDVATMRDIERYMGGFHSIRRMSPEAFA